MLDRIALYCALLSCGCAVGWMYLVATFDYGGNWTAFYRTGSNVHLPPSAAQENLVLSQGGGYDGQYYRLIAQDPLMLHGTERFIDGPRLRYRRILVPAMAHVFGTYVGVVILFLGLGTYWLSCYAAAIGQSPWWGLAFILAPAAFLSIDRLTVDIALAALTVAFALYGKTGSPWKLYLVLIFAPLAKETGFLFLAAFVICERRWSRAAVMATAGIPAAIWFLYVQRHTSADATAWIQWPFSAVIEAMRHPGSHSFVVLLDYLAWIGLLLAIFFALARWRKDDPLSRAALMFALLAAVIDLNVWQEVEGFGRAFTPLLLLLPLAWPMRWQLLPLALILPRALVFPLSETLKVFAH